MNRNQPNSNREDMRLVAFLRHNQPIAPEPAIDLEQRIMGEIHRQAIPLLPKPGQKLWRRGLLVASGAIVAGIVAIWSVNRQMQPTISEVDRAQIEASLIENWSASVGEEINDPANSDPIADLHKTYE